MPHGREVGPGDSVTWGHSSPSPKGAHQPPPLSGPCLLWPNGSRDQDATWYGCRPWPRQQCDRWGLAPPKKGGTAPLNFRPMFVVANGWMDQDVTWYGGRPRSRRHCVRWGTQNPLKRGTASHFSADVHCSQTAGWIKMPLGTKVGLGPSHIVLDGDPVPPNKKGHSPQFSAHVYYGETVPISATAEHLLC